MDIEKFLKENKFKASEPETVKSDTQIHRTYTNSLYLAERDFLKYLDESELKELDQVYGYDVEGFADVTLSKELTPVLKSHFSRRNNDTKLPDYFLGFVFEDLSVHLRDSVIEITFNLVGVIDLEDLNQEMDSVYNKEFTKL